VLQSSSHPTLTVVYGIKSGAGHISADADHLAQAIKVLQPALLQRLDPRVMRVPAAIQPEKKFQLQMDGFGLAQLLSEISGYDPEAFVAIRKHFWRCFPQFKAVQVEPTTDAATRSLQDGLPFYGTESGNAIFFEMHSGQRLRAEQASDGAMLFLGFLALAHLPEPPALLLIEEPENGIYPKRLAEVIEMLKDMVERRDGVPFPQIIMSTHSPYMLSLFEPEDVTFLSRPAGDPKAPVQARSLRDAPNIRERIRDFYLGELWYNLSEEELFGES